MASSAHALHILVKHKELADDILEQLKKGARIPRSRQETLNLSIR